MEIRTFCDPAVSQYSYLVADLGKAVVIDPGRDVAETMAVAAEMRVTIEKILVTHLHADFAGGHLLMSKLTGAPIGTDEKTDAAWQSERMVEGHRFSIGNAEFRVVRTPGHTPDHISFELTDRASSIAPFAVFTGDTLFAGDVGRPDLFGADRQEELCRSLFASLARYRELPDHTLVYPCHGAGSLCGKRLSPRNPTTVGFEKHANEMFQIENYDDFRRELLTDMPAPPAYYFATSAKNRSGDGLLATPPTPRPFTPGQVRKYDGVVVDLRDQAAFAACHVPGSLNLAADIHLSITAGFTLSTDARICLVGAPDEVARAASVLWRMGYDHVEGFLLGEIGFWRESGLPTAGFPLLDPAAAQSVVASEGAVIVDVRTGGERNDVRLAGSLGMPLSRLTKDMDVLPRDRLLLLQCGHGCRGSLGASMLLRAGFPRVANLSGGIFAWRAAGLPVEV
jgi:glyoxylase-like metal-dependent hydrolase (beta-lactamase superfamily II)/rhodanese-related sulfurtransferase